MVVFLYIDRIGEFLLPQKNGIIYTIMKNIIQVDQLTYIYNH